MFRRGDNEDRNHEQPIQPKEVRMKEGAGSEVTVVGHGARLEGTVESAGSLRIDGQVKGKVNAEGDVMLTAQSQVEADIRAQNVTIAGVFKGNIAASGKAELQRGGRVEGNITSKTLVVAEGATFHGQSIMGQVAASAGSEPRSHTPGTSTSDGGQDARAEQVTVVRTGAPAR